MPTISKKWIGNPRKSHYCASCGKKIDGGHWRLFGMAYQGDPPYAVRVHDGCKEAADE